MTLRKLFILVGVLSLLTGIFIAVIWECIYSPPARARGIIADLKGDTSGLRGWLILRGMLQPNKFEELEPARFGYSIAADRLAKLGPEAVPTIIEGLRDGNRDVRVASARACGTLKDRRCVKPLIDCLRQSDADLAWEVVGALGQIGGPDVLDPLRKSAKHPGVGVRIAALDALELNFGQNETPAVIDALKDKDEQVRSKAIEMLGRLKDRRAVGPLTMLLKDDSYWTAAPAARSLARINDPKAVPSLLEALKHPDRSTRRELVIAMLQLAEKNGWDCLIAPLLKKDAAFQRRAIEDFRMVGDRRAIKPLTALAESDDARIRQEVAYAFGWLGGTGGIPALRKMLQDKDAKVRAVAAESLLKLGQAVGRAT